MIEYEAKAISWSDNEYADGKQKCGKVCEIVLYAHRMFGQWLKSCRFDTIDGMRYDVEQVVADYRFMNEPLVYKVTVRKLALSWPRKITVMVLLSSSEE